MFIVQSAFHYKQYLFIAIDIKRGDILKMMIMVLIEITQVEAFIDKMTERLLTSVICDVRRKVVKQK